MDFGTLFISKSPYHLEFDFTNVGNNAYDLFVALKNWKNKSETRFSCEPNRFKLQPDQTQKVKFFLNAESPAVGVCEEFSIVGSSDDQRLAAHRECHSSSDEFFSVLS
jgi:hypothetical protein